MSKRKKLFVHGGSSLLSKYLIKEFYIDFDEIHIFCRNIKKTRLILEIDQSNIKKFFFYENNLENIDQTISDINKLPDDLSGILWTTGYAGDPQIEFENLDKIKHIINVNFFNVVISVTKLTKKIVKNKSSFICVVTSVAGLRGRKKRLFYSTGKGGLIIFLSGLRQKMHNQAKIITVIPGYLSTNNQNKNAPKFLTTTPKKASQIIVEAIKKNKDIVYVSQLWRLIMFIILIIPEKIYKKLNL